MIDISVGSDFMYGFIAGCLGMFAIQTFLNLTVWSDS